MPSMQMAQIRLTTMATSPCMDAAQGSARTFQSSPPTSGPELQASASAQQAGKLSFSFGGKTNDQMRIMT